MKRALVAIFVALALAGCGSASPAPTPGTIPTGGQQSGEPSQQPTSSTGPGATDPVSTPAPTGPGVSPDPTQDEPLPEPTLTDGAEIAEALFDRDLVPDGVVSLVAAMGDLGLTEPEVRALIDMTLDDLTQMTITGGPYPLADMYTALQASLPAGYSFDDFRADYSTAYGSAPDSLAAQILRGQELSADSGLLRIQMWVMLIDGFVTPLASAASPMVGGSLAQLAPRPRIGTARSYLPSLTPPAGMTAAEWTELLSRLPTLASTVQFEVIWNGTIHEGHGSPGSPSSFSAAIGTASPVVSMSSGNTLLAASPRPGVAVRWATFDESVWIAHGQFDHALGTAMLVDPGQPSFATLQYTPIEETANGVGTVLTDIGFLQAKADQAEMLSHSYDTSRLGAALLLAAGSVTAQGVRNFPIRWHQLGTGYRINITWSDVYNGIWDTITFIGVANHRDSGVAGVNAYYSGRGVAFGSRGGWVSCNPGLEDVPSGVVDADFQAGLQDGKVTFAAFPSFGTDLAGIFAGPFTVNAEPDGDVTTIRQQADPFALCPHALIARGEAIPFGSP